MRRFMVTMKVGNDIYYVGVNDHQVDLFEGQYDVPNGMSYNSYVIMDEKIAVMDTVDAHFAEEWLGNVAKVLNGAKPDYLVVQHMEPDHAANIENFVKAYPEVTVVANTKTFTMMENFFRNMDLGDRKLVVANGESLTLGKHVLTFVFAFITSPESDAIFTRLVAADIIVPVAVYVFLLIVKQIQKKSKRDRENNGME